MTYRVMQQTEDGMDFCAAGNFVTWEAAESWIGDNGCNWPESSFRIEGEQNYHYHHDDYHDDEHLGDVPW